MEVFYVTMLSLFCYLVSDSLSIGLGRSIVL